MKKKTPIFEFKDFKVAEKKVVKEPILKSKPNSSFSDLRENISDMIDKMSVSLDNTPIFGAEYTPEEIISEEVSAPEEFVEERKSVPPVGFEDLGEEHDKMSKYLKSIRQDAEFASKSDKLEVSEKDMNSYISTLEHLSTLNEEQTDFLEKNKEFVTFNDMKEHYKTFASRVQIQLSSLGGGGVGAKDVLKMIDDNLVNLDSAQIEHIISKIDLSFLDSAEAISIINDTVDAPYINNLVNILDSADVVSVIGSTVDSSFVNNIVNILDSANTYDLIFQTVDSAYINPLVDYSLASINDLGDVEVASPVANEVLMWNGSIWENSPNVVNSVLNFLGTVDPTTVNAPAAAATNHSDTFIVDSSGTALVSWGLANDSVSARDLLVYDSNSGLGSWVNIHSNSGTGVSEVRGGFGIDISGTNSRPTVFVDSADLATSFLSLSGGTVGGEFTVSKARTNNLSESFKIKGNISDGSGGTIFTDMLSDYKSNDSSTSSDFIQYFGGTPTANSLLNKGAGDARYVKRVGNYNETITGSKTFTGPATFSSTVIHNDYMYLNTNSTNSNGVVNRTGVQAMIDATPTIELFDGTNPPTGRARGTLLMTNGNNLYLYIS